MLPRRQSIFHLGEEGGAAAVHHRVSVVGAASSSMAMGGGGGGRRARERERLVVGLQILVHHHHHGRHGHGHAHAANVVLKQMVRPRAAAGSRHGHGSHAFSCSFLKACYLCKRELSPDKDVYMYRYIYMLIRFKESLLRR